VHSGIEDHRLGCPRVALRRHDRSADAERASRSGASRLSRRLSIRRRNGPQGKLRVKLLLDENLSPRLLNAPRLSVSWTRHVRDFGLKQASGSHARISAQIDSHRAVRCSAQAMVLMHLTHLTDGRRGYLSLQYTMTTSIVGFLVVPSGCAIGISVVGGMTLTDSMSESAIPNSSRRSLNSSRTSWTGEPTDLKAFQLTQIPSPCSNIMQIFSSAFVALSSSAHCAIQPPMVLREISMPCRSNIFSCRCSG
jgi:hypothetical protein